MNTSANTKKENKPGAKKEKSVVSKVINIILWVFVAFAAVITVITFAASLDGDGVPAIGGKCMMHVQTDSMAPTFNPGDTLFCDKLAESERSSLEVGDVISFRIDRDGDSANGKEAINSHRIVEVLKTSSGTAYAYRTRGDKRLPEGEDPMNPVAPYTGADEDTVAVKDVLAKWNGKARVPFLGYVMNFLQSSIGFLCCIVLPLGAFFIYELVVFIMTVVSVKQENATAKLLESQPVVDEEEIKRRAIEEYIRQQAAAKMAENAAAPAEPAPAETAPEAETPAETSAPAEAPAGEADASDGAQN